METETAEVEKEPRTTLADLRNEKTAESSDQWPRQTPKTMILLYLFIKMRTSCLEKYCSEAIHKAILVLLAYDQRCQCTTIKVICWMF
jgi:hypothetical protein